MLQSRRITVARSFSPAAHFQQHSSTAEALSVIIDAHWPATSWQVHFTMQILCRMLQVTSRPLYYDAIMLFQLRRRLLWRKTYTLSQKRPNFWNSIGLGRNCTDRFWWYLTEILHLAVLTEYRIATVGKANEWTNEWTKTFCVSRYRAVHSVTWVKHINTCVSLCFFYFRHQQFWISYCRQVNE